MTVKIDISLVIDGSVKKFTREGLTVRETLRFHEMQDEIFKKIEKGEFTSIDNIMARSEFLASLFEGVTQDTIIDGLAPAEFEKEWTRIMKIIAPAEFNESDEKGK